MAHPLRVQRSRRPGWRKPPGSVMVTRPGPRGNPFTEYSAAKNVELFRQWLLGESMHGMLPQKREAILKQLPELRGKKLACFCSLESPCHGDVLCELANRLFVPCTISRELREDDEQVLTHWLRLIAEDECSRRGLKIWRPPSFQFGNVDRTNQISVQIKCDTVPITTS